MPVGYSDHSIGNDAAIMAVGFGATVIEKHFTINKKLPGADHKISDNVSIKEDEPRVLFVGQVHAEEVLGIEVILSLMNDLLDPRPEDYNHMNILKSYLRK